jgi:hypothetical protein
VELACGCTLGLNSPCMFSLRAGTLFSWHQFSGIALSSCFEQLHTNVKTACPCRLRDLFEEVGNASECLSDIYRPLISFFP